MLGFERKKILQAVQTVDVTSFESVALDLFRYQAATNPVYAQYLQLLRKTPDQVRQLTDIPCLPISFFKTHTIQSGDWEPEMRFTSSSTTGQIPSQHLVRDTQFYLNNAVKHFEGIYGDLSDWLVLALLPSYLERTGSSLVAMADAMIQRSNRPESGFFLNDREQLTDILQKRDRKRPTLLLGVSFALLDLAEAGNLDLEEVVIMETGGMKGRRKEITRTELHAILNGAFNTQVIHSEYGMTEMFSQAYTQGGLLFQPIPTLRAFATEIQDPFCVVRPGKTGQLNFVDLANIDTCAFICTEDIGRVHEDHRFEVLGRLDMAELRGCNLMVE